MLSIGRVVLLTAIWLCVSFYSANKIQTHGAYHDFYGPDCPKFLHELYGAEIESVRLTDSYETWAKKCSGTDIANYITAGLSFADGHGISLPESSPTGIVYKPYSWQGPGTSFLIGCVVKLFGANSVFPYFLTVQLIHFATALLVVLLVSRFTTNQNARLLTGILSVGCLPVIIHNSATGLFCSECPAALLLAGALVAFNFARTSSTTKQLILFSALSGILFGVTSYFREVHGTFGMFCVVLTFCHLACTRNFKRGFVLALVTLISIGMVQLPWKLRNKEVSGSFAMSTSVQWGFNLFRAHWTDWKLYKRWCPNCGLGLGDYIDHNLAIETVIALDTQGEKGIAIAAKNLAWVSFRHPKKFFELRIKPYPTLWFGQLWTPYSYAYCVLSMIGFLAYLWRYRSKAAPEVYSFFFFGALMSIIFHYETRYISPFYQLITPVTAGILWASYLSRNSKSTKNDPVSTNSSMALAAGASSERN